MARFATPRKYIVQDGRIGINSAEIHFSTNQDKIASKIITTFHVQDHVFMFHVQDMAFQSADNIKSYFAAKLPNAERGERERKREREREREREGELLNF